MAYNKYYSCKINISINIWHVSNLSFIYDRQYNTAESKFYEFY